MKKPLVRPCRRCGGSASVDRSFQRASRLAAKGLNRALNVRQDLRQMLKRFGLSRFSVEVKRDGTGKLLGLEVKHSQDYPPAVLATLPKAHNGVAITYVKVP